MSGLVLGKWSAASQPKPHGKELLAVNKVGTQLWEGECLNRHCFTGSQGSGNVQYCHTPRFLQSEENYSSKVSVLKALKFLLLRFPEGLHFLH